MDRVGFEPTTTAVLTMLG